MQIYVDADACPVIRQTEQIAARYGLKCTLLCDTSHAIVSEYSDVLVIGEGADAVDFALINRCRQGDLVVTQDYGVAALALGKGAYAIHQSGKEYTNDNIDLLLMERHIHKKERQASRKHHLKGAKKRTAEDNEQYIAGLVALIERVIH